MKHRETAQSKSHAVIASAENRADDQAFPKARDKTLGLLALRSPEGTICPSEVARVLAAAAGVQTDLDWRAAMPAVHAAVDRLMTDGLVELSWKGKTLAKRAGPYRIGRTSTT